MLDRRAHTTNQVRRPSLGFLALLILAPAAIGDIRYVDDSAPPGGDGLAWNTAYTHLQDALAEANSDPAIDQIRIAQGTYFPDRDEANPAGTGDRNATYSLVDGLYIRGGYGGVTEPNPDSTGFDTILSGDLAGDDAPDFANRTDNALHVVTAPASVGATTQLYNLIIRGGNADGTSPDDDGAGILISGAPRLSNCTLTDCEALDLGAGAYIAGSGNPDFLGCTFIANRTHTSERGGAGIATSDGAGTIRSCTFSNNEASRGAAVFLTGNAALGFEYSNFNNNTASSRGGAIHIASNTTNTTIATLLHCTLEDNSGSPGAALNNDNGTCTVTECTFRFNTAVGDGGAIAGIGVENQAIGETNISDSTFENNAAGGDGGAIRLSGQVCSISCSTFTSNTAAAQGGAAQVDKTDANISDCTFSTNEGGQGDPNFRGGAIHVRLCEPRIAGCVFIGNRCERGGAIGGGSGGSGSGSQPARLIGCSFSANEALSEAGAFSASGNLGWEVESCTFEGNVAGTFGGAITGSDNSGPLVFTDCSFSNNTALDGGAAKIAQQMTFEDCCFEYNAADRQGGAVFHRADLTGANAMTARRCAFIGNAAGTDEIDGTAGVYFADNDSHADFIDCLMVGNSSTRSVGVAEIRQGATATFTNCLLNANAAELNVGAINQNSSTVPDAVTITSCTIVNNSAEGGPVGGVGGAARIRGSILFGNSAAATVDEATQLSPTATIDYCCVQGLTGSLGGAGNISADPLFVDADGPDDIAGNADDDLRLSPAASPCIDAADNDADTDLIAPGIQPLPAADHQGGDRFLDDPAVADSGNGTAPIIDMGALESGSVAPAPPPPSDTIYVDSNATGANDGTSWTDALTDLQDALALASIDPDPFSLVVLIAQGTYAPGLPGGPAASTFVIPSGVTLQGGYDASTGLRDTALYETVLSGDLNGDDAPAFANRADNVVHVVSALCGSPTIDGCTIRGGRASSFGGGALVLNSSLTLINCRLIDNEAVDAGGAAYVADGQIRTTDSQFNGNRTSGSGSRGGAIFADLRGNIYDIRGTFSDNTSRSGGAIFMNTDSYSRLTLYGSTFDANSATGNSPSTGLGGAIALVGTNAYVIARTYYGDTPRFTLNTARVGGAIYADTARLYLNDTALNQNSATESGGGIYTLGSDLRLSAEGSITGNAAPEAAGLFAGPNARIVITPTYADTTLDSDAIVCRGKLAISRNTLDVDGAFECTGELSSYFYTTTSFGRVLASGPITLGGLFEVRGSSYYNSPGYLPSNGQLFNIIDGVARNGSFDTAYFRNFRFPDDRFLFSDYSSSDVFVRCSTILSSRSPYYDAYVYGIGYADTASGDLNNDGLPDLLLTAPSAIAPDTEPGAAFLLHNLGRSGQTWLGYGNTTQFAVGIYPYDVEIGQLDTTGETGPDLDVACANLHGDSVSVLRNLGGQSGGWNGLGDLQNFPVGNGPRDLAIADFNLDGRSDVATANFYEHNATILLNQGGSGAAWLGLGGRIDVPTLGANPYAIEARDLDRDGDPDLLVSLRYNRRVTVYLNNIINLRGNARGGPGLGFTEGATVDVQELPGQMIVDDLDGDTFEDIAVVNEGSGTVSIARGLGDGTFAPATHLPVGDNPVAICCYDAEGDGDLDLAITDVEPDGPRVVRTIRNDLDAGILQFAEAEVLDGAGNPHALIAADVDESGYPDLVAFNGEPEPVEDDPGAGAAKAAPRGGAGDIAVFLNDFVPPPPPCVGDLDDDDDTDVFDFNIFAPAFGSTGLPPFTGGDLDGDGDVDVFDFNIFAPDFGCPN